jgi:predicted nucleotidyltransferase
MSGRVVDETVVQEAIRRIRSVAEPDRVILFGSAATGAMTADSDIDLLVVERSSSNSHAESARIRQAIGDLGYPIDVVVMGRERFEETKGIVGGLAYPANRFGRVLYERA